MFVNDLPYIINWWLIIFVIGLVFLPFTKFIFSNFQDKGYIFSKIIGITILSYLIFLFGFVRLLKFDQINSIIILIALAIINLLFSKIVERKKENNLLTILKNNFPMIIFEEFLFFSALVFWSFIKGFQPNIYGLEKYMDFGFINSILRSSYFPPKDMWFTPLPINYYYFGHLITAVLTKLSGLPPSITYNLMLATIFAFTFTASFSIGANLFNLHLLQMKKGGDLDERDEWMFDPDENRGSSLASEDKSPTDKRPFVRAAFVGFLTAFLVALSGNLHTIYIFLKPYLVDNPLPFWNLIFSPTTIPNLYWYPNATRFIYHTIHEFPLYSFVVSDLHGHVLDIPIVLTTIALLLNEFISKRINKYKYLLVAFLIAVCYMTNVWDGLIYLVLTILVLVALKIISRENSSNLFFTLLLIIAGFLIFSFPFMFNFKPFASGIGVLCAPDFLTNIGKIGPFLFEKDHCQRSPLWQLLILYGFFYFWVISFLFFVFGKLRHRNLFRNLKLEIRNLNSPDIFVLILIILSSILIIIPEFIYVKDIYPAHYRANTMFKLVYQAFIMLSLSCGYIIVRIISKIKMINWGLRMGLFAGIICLLLVSVYPYYAINSYYEDLKHYRGLDGLLYLKNLYPSDYEAIIWLNKNIKGQPVILEAQGDSYTDYARVSANTGLPTVLGWTVHEWLWRGTYDIPAPRIVDVQRLYETESPHEAKNLIKKYNISYIFIGALEKEKYTKLNRKKFNELGNLIYKNNETEIYKTNN